MAEDETPIAPRKPLTPAAKRALAEAAARQRAARETEPAGPVEKELGGAEGPEPTRYGDWERKGIATDF